MYPAAASNRSQRMPVQRWRFGGAGGRALVSRAGGASSLVSCREAPPLVDGADFASGFGGARGASTSLCSIIVLDQTRLLAGRCPSFLRRTEEPTMVRPT